MQFDKVYRERMKFHRRAEILHQGFRIQRKRLHDTVIQDTNKQIFFYTARKCFTFNPLLLAVIIILVDEIDIMEIFKKYLSKWNG